MGKSSWAARAVGIVIFAVPGLVSCADDARSGSDKQLKPAVVAQASFAVVTDGGQLVVVSGDETIPVTGTQFDSESARPSVSAISRDAVALTADGLMVMRAGGSVDRVDCEGCGQVVWTGRDLAVVRDSVMEGGTFEIVYYDTNLKRRSTTVARRITERAAPGAEPESDSGGVELLAANQSTVWVSYTDRFGFARGGSRTIAAYSRKGDLLQSTQVEGTIYRHSVSPDGRFLAVADGGTSGACITVGEIDVIDLTTMRTLDTTPRMPVGAELQAAPIDLPSLNFYALDLRWRGTALTVAGVASRGNAPEVNGGCDPAATAWERTYDVQDQRFTDRQTQGEVVLPVGPGCGDSLRWKLSSNATDTWELQRTPGTPLHGESSSLLYLPSAPAGC